MHVPQNGTFNPNITFSGLFFLFSLIIDAPDSRITDSPDHWHGNEGAQMVLSLSHIVRIAVCNISTRGPFFSTSCVWVPKTDWRNYTSPQDIGYEALPRLGQPIFFWCASVSYLSLCPALVPFDPPKTRVFPRAAPILDFAWYPRATPRDASSFCFAASVRESPVQLLDASDGRVSYFFKYLIRLRD